MNCNKYYKKYKLNYDTYNLEGGAVTTNSVIPDTINDNDIDTKENQVVNEDITLSSVKLPFMNPSKTTVYTIFEGTILYHGSMMKESFNPDDIRLGTDNLVSYFSPNKRLAADYITGCALYPSKNGYIHKFRVKKDITKLMILSTYEKNKEWDLKFYENSFCSNKYRIQLNCIGFFYPMSDELSMEDIDMNSNDTSNYDSEFALCNPNEFLEYISTQRCIAARKISDEYRFTKNKVIS